MKRHPRQKLDPNDIRADGVDRDGTAWIDGNPKGIKTSVTTDAYRDGWERAFGGKGATGKRDPAC